MKTTRKDRENAVDFFYEINQQQVCNLCEDIEELSKELAKKQAENEKLRAFLARAEMMIATGYRGDALDWLAEVNQIKAVQKEKDQA